MIDLKNEIEKAFFIFDEDDDSMSFLAGYNAALNWILSLLNKYNIITAPKTIKLSEIVSKLEKLKKYYYIYSISYDKQTKSIYDTEDDIIPIAEFNEDLTFKEISLPIRDNNKWLYTLWIAGTEIIDDMEE